MRKNRFIIISIFTLLVLSFQFVTATPSEPQKPPHKVYPEEQPDQPTAQTRLSTENLLMKGYFPFASNEIFDPFESNDIGDAVLIKLNQIVNGTISQEDKDDVFAIEMEAGQTIQVTLSGEGGDADLYLYPPSATTVKLEEGHVQFSQNDNNDELIVYNINESGSWYINVFSFEGETAFQLTVSIKGGR